MNVTFSALGRYEIRGEIGRGTMGVVYRGYDPVIDREIAVKTILFPDTLPIPQQKIYLERFIQEARIAGKLLHSNIVVTYDAATDDKTDTPFIAMELVKGESLSSSVARRKRLPWREAFDLVISMAGALDYAHRNGIIHRDIKPANVLVGKKGEPKITDFGIAKMPTSDLTQAGVVLGTPTFMSPEQLQGEELDGRSDLFALGALLYNLIVGKPPFEAPDIKSVSELVLYKDPRPPSEIVEGLPETVDGVLARALTKARDDRYGSGRAFAEDLAAVRENRPPILAVVPGEQTQAEGESTTTPKPKTQPTFVLETTAESPSSGRPFRWLVPTLLLAGAIGYVVVVGPDRAKEQVGPWWSRLSDAMGRQVVNVQTMVEETFAERKRVSAAQDEAESHLQRGRAMEARGQWDRARQEYGTSLDIFRDIMGGGGEASALLARGRLESVVGNWSRARADLDSAASVYRIYDQPADQVRAMVFLGNLERDRGNRDRAEAHYGRALSLAEELEDRGPWLEARLNMALLDLLQGRWRAAREAFASVRSRGGVPEHRNLATRAVLWLGIESYADGNLEMAANWWEEARRTFQDGGEAGAIAEIELLEGRADLDRGELGSSRKHIEEAERVFRKVEHLSGLAAALESRLELCLLEEDDEEQRVVWEELFVLRARLALPDLEMPSREAGDESGLLYKDARFTRLASLLRARPRNALTEERLATFRVAGDEATEGSRFLDLSFPKAWPTFYVLESVVGSKYFT